MNFNEAFMLAWEDARKRRGLNKGEFMKQSGINRQRMREFLGGTREVSAYYFAKVLEGMRMTPEQFERAFNYSFSEEQKRELKVDAWFRAHRDLVRELAENPELVVAVQSLIDASKRMR